MSWSKYALLTLILVLIFTMGAFGARFGWEVDGVPKGGDIGATPAFLWDMVAFQIDGRPALMSGVFDIILILIIFMAVNWVRGVN